MKFYILLAFGLCTASLAFVEQCDASNAIIQHSGNLDPTTTGWFRQSPSVSGITAFPVTNDLGLGVDSWAVDDNSAAGGSLLFYIQDATISQQNLAASSGWSLRTNLRVLDDGVPGGSVEVEYNNGATRYLMAFSTDADGDPTVTIATGFTPIKFTGPTFTLEDVGSTYHEWELRFDPISASADLFVDGVNQLQNYHGLPTQGPFSNSVIWGGASSIDVGQGNWNLVEWAIIPEPSSMVLTACVIAVVASCVSRRSKD